VVAGSVGALVVAAAGLVALAGGRHAWVAPADCRGAGSGSGESVIRTALQGVAGVVPPGRPGCPAWAGEPLPAYRRLRAIADSSPARLCLIS
jgi:hypothetical protein